MADPAQATRSQLANIEKKTGKTLAQLSAAIKACGKDKHGEVRAWVVETFGLGAGDANTLTHFALHSDGASRAAGVDAEQLLDEIYAGKKACLRPVHEKLMAAIEGFGPFDIAPKKGYFSLRRKKQFAMLGPKTNERFELGLNLKHDIRDTRVKPVPTGGMCQYIVPLTNADEIDAKLIDYIRQAYDAAG